MLVALFPLVDRKRSKRSGNNPNQIQNWPSINGKYENTLYTCIYQKHEVPVYTVEIGSKLQTGTKSKSRTVFYHSFKQSYHMRIPCLGINLLDHIHSLFMNTHSLLDKVEKKKSFNLQSLYKQ